MRTCGILGGMGPEATIDLMRRIVAHTRAQDDADHVHCLVDNNPQVPSRIKVLLEGGTVSPGPCMAAMGRGLEAQGADFLCIACNTAHNWRDEVARAVNIPVLDMIALAAAEAARRAPKARAGILASPAVRLTGLYEAPCRGQGLEPVFADEAEEARLLGVIRAIKAGRTGDDVRAEARGRKCAEQGRGRAHRGLHRAWRHRRGGARARGGCRRCAGRRHRAGGRRPGRPEAAWSLTRRRPGPPPGRHTRTPTNARSYGPPLAAQDLPRRNIR